MTKQAFLSELKRELSQVNESLYEEILADINDHFAAGAAQGKTEEEICQNLGQPEAIAAQVLEEIGVEPNSHRPLMPPIPPKGSMRAWQRMNRPMPKMPPMPEMPSMPNTDQTFSGVENMDIEVDNSKIRFLPSTTDEVRVTVRQGDVDHNIHMEVTNGTLYVKLKSEKRLRSLSNWGSHQTAETTVYVPAQFMGNIAVSSSAGSIKASGISGNVDFESSAGSIVLEDHRGSNIRLDTSAGSIKAYLKSSVVENIDIDSSAGSVVVEAEETRRLKVDSSAGSITVNVRKLGGDTELDSSAGSIKLTAHEVEGNITLDSSAGSVLASLPYDVNCRIKAKKPNIGSLINQLAGNPDSPYVLKVSSSVGSVTLRPIYNI